MPKLPKFSKADANVLALMILAGVVGWAAGKLVSKYVIAPLNVVKISVGDPGRAA